MKELNEYFQAQAALKEKQIREAKSYIPKILTLCLKKGIHFDFSPSSESICTYIIPHSELNLRSYFSEDLVNYEDGHCCTLKTMYEKIKSYKCK